MARRWRFGRFMAVTSCFGGQRVSFFGSLRRRSRFEIWHQEAIVSRLRSFSSVFLDRTTDRCMKCIVGAQLASIVGEYNRDKKNRINVYGLRGQCFGFERNIMNPFQPLTSPFRSIRMMEVVAYNANRCEYNFPLVMLLRFFYTTPSKAVILPVCIDNLLH
ncbi:unnamed protein product [Albugo candida]|uniref:Uncharacterized protein n=1 Tax=Albugo candida TaxID=65357 RepID=A0A024FVQ1_9STRA|nr:unnamed protein product [Albugo candida]|eukprot:CCI11205.1 unnamed protein product [Albugo candida]